MNNINSIVNNFLVFLYNSSKFIVYIGGSLALLALGFDVYVHFRNSDNGNGSNRNSDNENNMNRWSKIRKVIFVIVLFFVLLSMIIGYFGTIVPDILGCDGVEAKQKMENRDLEWCDPYGLDNRYLKDAIVTNVVPWRGTFVWKSKKIFIVVTMNDKTYISHVAVDMPDVTGMKQTEAARLLESMGIDSHTIWPEVYNYGDPIVSYQSVSAGTPIKPWEEAVELHIR